MFVYKGNRNQWFKKLLALNVYCLSELRLSDIWVLSHKAAIHLGQHFHCESKLCNDSCQLVILIFNCTVNHGMIFASL